MIYIICPKEISGNDIMLLLIGIVSWLYIYFRAIRNLKLALSWQLILSVIAAIAALKFQILRRIGGGMFFSPELPIWVLNTCSIIYGIYFFFFALLIPADIIFLLGNALVNKINGTKFSALKSRRIFTAAILVFAAILSVSGFCCARRLPQVKNYQVKISKFKGKDIKIALLADLHIDSTTTPAMVEEIVEMTDRLEPDIILIAGDFVDGKIENRRDAVAKLAGLRAQFGVFGVSGNHEFYSGYHDWIAFLNNLGIVMLENRHVTIDNRLTVAGTSDRNKNIYNVKPDIHAALAGADPALPTIILAHQPKSFAENKKYGALQLSGHTHGGMIRGMDLIVALLNDNYVSGLYQEKDAALIVSNGTRLWGGFPFRIGVPAEISLITISDR